ncbi:unnamed protein product [Paramecium sonneborni]|uniref:Uncharacterized protein n=1 Tax=Paramecium sonneborni TaxID=65129 RepID=A0A8S1QWP1_9CILI|nr:unnamed protein product [Paramecium sonneborni]
MIVKWNIDMQIRIQKKNIVGGWDNIWKFLKDLIKNEIAKQFKNLGKNIRNIY